MLAIVHQLIDHPCKRMNIDANRINFMCFFILIIGNYPINETKRDKIKLEVDTNPPLGFSTEEKLLLRPFSFYTKCFSAPDLLEGRCMLCFLGNGRDE
ncbi:MAG: hypothetical protein ACXVH2_08490 [Methanobacterium sp.]